MSNKEFIIIFSIVIVAVPFYLVLYSYFPSGENEINFYEIYPEDESALGAKVYMDGDYVGTLGEMKYLFLNFTTAEKNPNITVVSKDGTLLKDFAQYRRVPSERFVDMRNSFDVPKDSRAWGAFINYVKSSHEEDETYHLILTENESADNTKVYADGRYVGTLEEGSSYYVSFESPKRRVNIKVISIDGKTIEYTLTTSLFGWDPWVASFKTMRIRGT